MARTDFTIDDEGNLSGDGALHAIARAAGGTGLGEAVPLLVRTFQDLEDTYRDALANDGRLLGPERPALVSRFDMLFESALLCWRATQPRGGVEWQYEYGEPVCGLRLAVHGSQESWKAGGHFPEGLLDARMRLADGLAGHLRPALQNLLAVLKGILADGKIDGGEREALATALGPFLRDVIILRRQVEGCLVDD